MRRSVELYLKNILEYMDRAEGYFEVDYQQIWLTVKEDIPALKPQIEQILEDL